MQNQPQPSMEANGHALIQLIDSAGRGHGLNCLTVLRAKFKPHSAALLIIVTTALGTACTAPITLHEVLIYLV